MSYRIRYTSRARSHVREILLWWRQNRPDAGDLVVVGLKQAERLLQHAPLAGQTYRPARHPGVRRLRVWTTPYHVYYYVIEDELEVVIWAVWSAARRRGPKLVLV